MNQRYYPLPTHEPVPLFTFECGEVDKPIMWNWAPTYADGFEVVLASAPQGSWRVQRDRLPIAAVSAEARKHYKALELLYELNLQPTARALITTGAEGSLSLDLVLPDPDWALPHNNLPEDIALAPDGPTYRLDSSQGDGNPPDYSRNSSDSFHRLVVLSTIGGVIVVAEEETVLGTIPVSVSEVAALEAFGGTIGARAYFLAEETLISCDFTRLDHAHSLPTLPLRSAQGGGEILSSPDITVTPLLDPAPTGTFRIIGPGAV